VSLSRERCHGHLGDVTDVDVADPRLIARAVEGTFGSDRRSHEGDGVLHEAVRPEKRPGQAARLDGFFDGSVNLREADGLLGGSLTDCLTMYRTPAAFAASTAFSSSSVWFSAFGPRRNSVSQASNAARRVCGWL